MLLEEVVGKLLQRNDAATGCVPYGTNFVLCCTRDFAIVQATVKEQVCFLEQ